MGPPIQVTLYDAHTLGLIAEFNVSGDDSPTPNFVFSADSKTLFVSSERMSMHMISLHESKLPGHQVLGLALSINLLTTRLLMAPDC